MSIEQLLQNTTLFVVCHACIRVEAVSSIMHIFCDEKHALEAFFQPKITRERDRIENLFNLWITQVPVHRGGGAHVDGGDDWESRERLGRRWGGWGGGRSRQPMECASFGLKTNKKTLNEQIFFYLKDSVVGIQILFLFWKLFCVINLIKPGKRIVLRKHLPPAARLYCHIIGQVPGEDKKWNYKKTKIRNYKRTKMRNYKKKKKQGYKRTEKLKTKRLIVT